MNWMRTQWAAFVAFINRNKRTILSSVVTFAIVISTYGVIHYSGDDQPLKKAATVISQSTDQVFLINASDMQPLTIAGPEITLKPYEGVELRFENGNEFRYDKDWMLWSTTDSEKPVNVLKLECDNGTTWSPSSLDASQIPTMANFTPTEIKCNLVFAWPMPRPKHIETIQRVDDTEVNAPITAYARIVPIDLPSPKVTSKTHSGNWAQKEIEGAKLIKDKTVKEIKESVDDNLFIDQTL